MSGAINIGGLRLTEETPVVSVRILREEIGRVAEVRFLVEDDGLEDTSEHPQRIESACQTR